MLMRWRFKHPMSRSGQANGSGHLLHGNQIKRFGKNTTAGQLSHSSEFHGMLSKPGLVGHPAMNFLMLTHTRAQHLRCLSDSLSIALHTQHFHTQLCHTQVLHMKLFRTPLFHRQLFHRPLLHTHNSFAYSFDTPNSFTHRAFTLICQTQVFDFFELINPPPPLLFFLPSPSRFNFCS